MENNVKRKKSSHRSKKHDQSVWCWGLICSKVSRCFNNYWCYWMHTDDFNKSSKMFDICINILFIISYVSHILLDILWKLRSTLTLSVNSNFLLGYHASLTSSPTQICKTLIRLRILYYWHDSYTKITGVLFSYWPSKNWDNLKFVDLNTF